VLAPTSPSPELSCPSALLASPSLRLSFSILNDGVAERLHFFINARRTHAATVFFFFKRQTCAVVPYASTFTVAHSISGFRPDAPRLSPLPRCPADTDALPRHQRYCSTRRAGAGVACMCSKTACCTTLSPAPPPSATGNAERRVHGPLWSRSRITSSGSFLTIARATPLRAPPPLPAGGFARRRRTFARTLHHATL